MVMPPSTVGNPSYIVLVSPGGGDRGITVMPVVIDEIDVPPGPISQEGRLGVFTSPLGKDVLVLSRFDAVEGLSEIFEYRLELLSSQPNINFDNALGHNCCAKFKSPDGPDRCFNGVMVEAQWIGQREDLYVYRATLKPWYWLLSRTSDCRVWHDKTAVEIITQVFNDRGFSDFEKATTKEYPKLGYCVQYRETDLAFTMRLMERHGIYFFFKHTDSKHTLVLADSKSSHHPIPGHAVLPYFPPSQVRRDQEHVDHWVAERRFRTGKYETTDYDFKQPGKNLKSQKEANANYNKSKMEIFDYPGKYLVQNDGDDFADVRLQADQSLDKRRHATGNAISVFPGGLTTLKNLSSAGGSGGNDEMSARSMRESASSASSSSSSSVSSPGSSSASGRGGSSNEDIEYLTVRASHTFMLQSYRSGAGAGTDYFGSYEFVDASIPYRAPLSTPRPIVHGPQTAKVVGKEGEEIDVDEHGRILVLFHWDRKKNNSCRARVAQMWAGKGWGTQFIPRIGMEVVVEFLEGDPDRPIVIGSVYNGDNNYPYKLDANKTQSGIKSDSSLGHSGYNEFMFEDKASQEKIRMHAQKDHEVTILNKETTEIGEKFADFGASRKTTLINGNDELTIKMGDQKLKIPLGKQTVDIGMQQDTEVGLSISMKAGLAITLTCGASSIAITPTSISLTSGVISLTAPVVNIGAGLTTMTTALKVPAIQLTAPPIILPA